MQFRTVVYEQARLWHNTLKVQEERLFGPSKLADPTADVWFSLIALRAVLRTASMASTVDLADVKSIQAAVTRFEAGAASKHVRDVFEHLDAYMSGQGRLQDTGDVGPRQYLPTIWPEEDGRWRVHGGRYFLILPDAFGPARELLQVVRRALPDGSAGRHPEPDWT
jgi:hypothetical protein